MWSVTVVRREGTVVTMEGVDSYGSHPAALEEDTCRKCLVVPSTAPQSSFFDAGTRGRTVSSEGFQANGDH